MTKSTKIALLLSGKFSDNTECINSIIHNIIQPFNADVFVVSISDIPQHLNPISYYGEIPHEISTTINTLKIYPKQIETNEESFVNMIWGIHTANKLKLDYEEQNGFKYDFVVRCRPDLLVKNRIEFFRDDIWIPIGWDHRGGYNDTFAYGSSESMDWYSDLYNKVLQYANETNLIHPESMLKYHLDKSSFGIMRWYYPMELRGMKINELNYRQK